MRVCADKHEEVVFEGGRFSDCPMCVLIAEHNDEVKDLKDKIEELEDAE